MTGAGASSSETAARSSQTRSLRRDRPSLISLATQLARRKGGAGFHKSGVTNGRLRGRRHLLAKPLSGRLVGLSSMATRHIYGTAFGPLPPAGAGRRRANWDAQRPCWSSQSLNRRLAEVASLRYVVFQPVSPHEQVGGETGRLALCGRSLRSRDSLMPPPVPPSGGSGEERAKRRVSRFGDGSRRSPST